MSVLSALALLVALIAIAASARRLWVLHDATALDPSLLVASLRAGVTPVDLGRALSTARVEPEASLVAAILAPDQERAGRTNEVLMDMEERLDRWSRVPRVAASVASSSGFLLASLALRQGLAPSANLPELPPELHESLLYGALGDGLNAVALGLFGALTCATLSARARKLRKSRRAGIDQLVHELESRSGLPAPDRLV